MLIMACVIYNEFDAPLGIAVPVSWITDFTVEHHLRSSIAASPVRTLSRCMTFREISGLQLKLYPKNEYTVVVVFFALLFYLFIWSFHAACRILVT